MDMVQETSSLIAGVPELLILRLLQDREMYGYEIVRAIGASTSGSLTLAEGVVYPVLHDLKRDGALKSRRRTVEGRSRVYYTLTAAGRARLATLTRTWKTLTDAIQSLLGGGNVKTV